MTTAETGRKGEQAAAEYLRCEGFELCALNWRSGRYELDIVARKDDELHIVEVKARRADGLTAPEAAMTPQKQRALLHAARAYLAWMHWMGEVRFDLAAVDCFSDGRMEVRLIPDALQCHW
ncbi:MAG: YraN family protein [Alistipes sp.]|nr:YraN family protein [Alistipes sp.]